MGRRAVRDERYRTIPVLCYWTLSGGDYGTIPIASLPCVYWPIISCFTAQKRHFLSELTYQTRFYSIWADKNPIIVEKRVIGPCYRTSITYIIGFSDKIAVLAV